MNQSRKNRRVGLKPALTLTSVLISSAVLLSGCAASPSGGASATASSGGTVSMEHYFSDSFGEKAFKTIVPECTAESGQTISNSPMSQEAFKSSILVQLAGGNPPGVFSYWAGAKTSSLVGKELLSPIDAFWKKNNLDSVIPAGIVKSASTYDGKKYLLPFDYHYVGMFYNPKVMADAGITTMPTTWNDLISVAEKLKAKGITPFALGSKDEWPAQFWFDYILLRTAGPDYRQKLMTGSASYTDKEVTNAFGLWKQLFDKGLFNSSPNGIDATAAANLVSKGDAAMTLMGTWVTGAWDANGIVAVKGYDMFPFPEITPGVEQAALGPVDGWVVPAKASNKAGAEKVLACLAGAKAQQTIALTEGALAPNKNADLSTQNDVMKKAAGIVGKAKTFVFNYDLATPPEVSAEGLNMMAQFVDKQSGYESQLSQLQQKVGPLFKK